MDPRSTVVGAFILGALALVVAGILFFGGTRLFSTSTQAVVFFGESVAGLDVGSPVTFHGVRIGSVKSISIHFAPDTMTARIPVYLEIQPTRLVFEGRKLGGSAADYRDLVRAGLRAQLTLQSFVTGQLRVDLDFRPGTPAQLIGRIKDVPEIPAVPSELSQLRNQLAQLPLRELADTARDAFTSVERLSDHLDAQLYPLLDSAQRTTDAAARTLRTTDETIRALQAEASTTLRNLDSLLIDANRQVNSRGDELGHTLTTANRAVREGETLLESLNSLAEPHSQFREDLEATLRDLAASAASLRGFAETIERDPNALLVGRASR